MITTEAPRTVRYTEKREEEEPRRNPDRTQMARDGHK
jgi:hypothetical protein